MKKLALAFTALGILATPVSAEIVGLGASVSTYDAIAESAQTRNGGRTVTVVSTEEAASSFGGFNPRKTLPSTKDPIVQSR